jgi:type II secretory pathway pseudopilin PulG
MRIFLCRGNGGYAMVALLVTLGVMGVILGVAMPVWRTVVQREKEEELIFRGRQYARAIQLYQRKFAASYPASVDLLVEQKFLRKKYTDPMTKGGEFEIIYRDARTTAGGLTAGERRPDGPTRYGLASAGLGIGALTLPGRRRLAPGGASASPARAGEVPEDFDGQHLQRRQVVFVQAQTRTVLPARSGLAEALNPNDATGPQRQWPGGPGSHSRGRLAIGQSAHAF